MAGHRPFADLKKDWSPERRAESEARKAQLAAELDADTLRHEMELARVPNATTCEAMDELSAGQGAKFGSVDALMTDLREGS